MLLVSVVLISSIGLRIFHSVRKLETELMNIIPRWEADHDMAFLVQDVRVIDLISEEIRAKEEAIEAKRVSMVSRSERSAG